ncbi:hypothetical protein EW145_g3546 [Phellinidium pouzarii]|uniref:DUF7330 domain-containing protein n=1 Tax=Phellinidium pouzarii TaxID=167371 RepID=A0A4V3XCU7_9AGAM|nr:hypothetical protein EW145_g3546 [Phellinidium pouzarii]
MQGKERRQITKSLAADNWHIGSTAVDVARLSTPEGNMAIITDDNEMYDVKVYYQKPSSEDPTTNTNDVSSEPPPYTPPPPAPSQLPRSSSSASASTSARATGESCPNVPASNFLTIKRENASIKGTYVIDPTLQIPPEEPSSSRALSADDDDNIKKNLNLHCKNGSISATVWLVGEDSQDELHRAAIDANSKNGSVNLKLNTTTSRPFTLTAFSQNGSVNVAIPSSFVGPVEINTRNGSVSLSDLMTSRIATFSDIDGKRVCYIGDFKEANYTGRKGWIGSTIDLGSHNGHVRLSFVDERGPTETAKGFWTRLFRGT